ncbi:MAG: glycosyltransferase family 39 protein [Anaerolineae bacterium]|nr:glycosyltransferase family 39 protein [Anaerolineae bacterium]
MIHIFTQLIQRHIRALLLQSNLHAPSIPKIIMGGLVGMYLIGLLGVVELSRRPFWLITILLFALQPLVIYVKQRRIQGAFIESLAPLTIVYLMAAVRVFLAVSEHLQNHSTGSLTVPEPWGQRLDLNVAMVICGVWVLLAQLPLTAQALGKPRKWLWQAAAVVLIGTAILWAGRVYLTIRAHGATASDPFAYIQMAVDFGNHQTPRHTFDLAHFAAAHDLPLGPLAHVGYLSPDSETGQSATVWPVGYSVLMGLGYAIGGESVLYLFTPLMGILTLLVTALFCNEILRRWPVEKRWLVAGVAAIILATSFQQTERLVVPMADIPAQVFTVLTFVLAFRALRGRTNLFAALAGICLGVAFAVRYTQVLIGPAVLLLFVLDYWETRSKRKLIEAILWFGGAAALMALPVLWYHNTAFGGPFEVGSKELGLFHIRYVPDTAEAMLRALLSGREFYYLSPFLLWGAVRLWTSFHRETVVLLVWGVVITVFHLFYAALRLRDLLPQFPILVLIAGVGIIDMLYQAARVSKYQTFGRVAVAFGIVSLIWLRTDAAIRLAIIPSFNTFGLLTVEQRDALDKLEANTPPDAIVAVSLNSGPVSLYAHRETVRPYEWTDEEWLKFVGAALESGYPVYLLRDGYEMEAPLELTQLRYDATLIGAFFLPYFYPGAGSINQQVELYRITPRRLIGDSLQDTQPLS